ncbi:MAG TPA: phosphate signaling complex protein PhoU [Bacteroidales bacterium]|nr:phosphate signaling complex protein PhoU [Bacteroidales bacterium]
MTHLDTELKQLRASVVEMWHLVISQLGKAKTVIENNDRDLYAEVKANEKRVDAFEIKLDMDCENILALFNPVASDLRFVLSVLKINYNLERIGDYAKGTAAIVKDCECNIEANELKETRIPEMFSVCIDMLTEALEAFEKEDNSKARNVFGKDDILDQINKQANTIGAKLIDKNPKKMITTLSLLSVIRKLERVGDQTKNISEEIIFYLEAKVLKHRKKKELFQDKPDASK